MNIYNTISTSTESTYIRPYHQRKRTIRLSIKIGILQILHTQLFQIQRSSQKATSYFLTQTPKPCSTILYFFSMQNLIRITNSYMIHIHKCIYIKFSTIKILNKVEIINKWYPKKIISGLSPTIYALFGSYIQKMFFCIIPWSMVKKTISGWLKAYMRKERVITRVV